MSHWHQATLNWIDTLPDDILAYLRNASAVREYPRGSMIFEPEPEPDTVYLLESGRIRIYRNSSQGGEFTFSFVEPGFIFGELPILENIERRNFAEAVEKSSVIKIPKESFLYSMHHSLEFSNNISLQLAKRLTDAKVNIEDLVFKDAKSRVARKLIELSVKPQLHLTHADVAKLTGISRPTASIVLGELEDDQVIEKNKGVFTINDLASLRAIAASDIR